MARGICVCFWQNQRLIHLLNKRSRLRRPPASEAQQHLNATLGSTFQQASDDMAELSTLLAVSKGVAPGRRCHRRVSATSSGQQDTPKVVNEQAKPITTEVGEVFTVTLTVVGYFTLLLSLPLLLYQLYAFVVPRSSREERRIAIPTMIAAPLLFAMGAALPLPAATARDPLPPGLQLLAVPDPDSGADRLPLRDSADAGYRFRLPSTVAAAGAAEGRRDHVAGP